MTAKRFYRISAPRLIVHIIARCSSLTIVSLHNYNRRVNCCIVWKDMCERFLIFPASRIINREPVSYIYHFLVYHSCHSERLSSSLQVLRLLRDIFTKESIQVSLLFHLTYVRDHVTAHIIVVLFFFFLKIYLHFLHRFMRTVRVSMTTAKITII